MRSLLLVLALWHQGAGLVSAEDLADIQKRGKLRHLGVVYANFVTGSGDGFSVEMMQAFAEELGLEYEYVETTWVDVLSDLTGKRFERHGDEVRITGTCPVRGDLISNGLTRLPWRETLVDYSEPVFPTQVWAIVRADSPLEPVEAASAWEETTAAVKQTLRGKKVLCMPGTCLDPSLYDFQSAQIQPVTFDGNMNELVPRLLGTPTVDATILDVPDALLAIRSWPGEIKILGPVSAAQVMGVGFRKDSPQLREAFATFYQRIRQDGTYERLLRKYYPAVFTYYPEFFQSNAP